MKIFEMTCLVLLIISGILWGLVGLFNFNLLDCLIGSGYWLTNLINFLFGVAGVWAIAACKLRRKKNA
jgi:uncharacterized protein